MARRTRGGIFLVAVTTAVLALARSTAGDEAAVGTADGGAVKPIDIRTVSGTIASVARGERSITLSTGDGPVKLEVDRNTSIFLESHLGTIRELMVGTPVRAAFGPAHRAFWIEVRRADRRERAAQASAAGTAEGRPVLPVPRDGGSVPREPPAAASTGASPGPPTDVPAGPGTPEPNPGGTPPLPPSAPGGSPGPVGPTPGPGPVPGSSGQE